MIGRLLIVACSLVVTRCQTDTSTVDVRPPERLDVVMVPGQSLDAMRAACDQMGGGDLTSPDGVWFTCEGVDY